MNTITINGKSFQIELRAVEDDNGSTWRNGEAQLPDGTRFLCGGGWIENAESANLKNEEAGIAGGLRQGVFYPNETFAGEFTPYAFGEDESGWENQLMPYLYGENWEDREEADDERRAVHQTIQEALAQAERRES